MGGLTSWNARSGDSGLGGRVWTACCTESSRAGGCGWGWSAGSCLPLLLQRSSPCWGSACGYCRAEEATLVTARQSCTFSRVTMYGLGPSISVSGSLPGTPPEVGESFSLMPRAMCDEDPHQPCPGQAV